MPTAGLLALPVVIMALAAYSAVHAAGAPLTAPALNPAAQTAPAGLVRFDLRRQPLQAALEQFHKLTGQSLLYDSAIVKGRMSSPVRDLCTPEAALHRLLEGTGLIARYTSETAFVLVLQPRAASQPKAHSRMPPAAMSARRRVYFSQVQAQVEAALCGNAATIPGTYRLALSIWIGADSLIGRVALNPTGSRRRDDLIRAALTGLPLAGLPPAEVAQPITLLVLPRPPAQTGDCTGAGSMS